MFELQWNKPNNKTTAKISLSTFTNSWQIGTVADLQHQAMADRLKQTTIKTTIPTGYYPVIHSNRLNLDNWLWKFANGKLPSSRKLLIKFLRFFQKKFDLSTAQRVIQMDYFFL